MTQFRFGVQYIKRFTFLSLKNIFKFLKTSVYFQFISPLNGYNDALSFLKMHYS